MRNGSGPAQEIMSGNEKKGKKNIYDLSSINRVTRKFQVSGHFTLL